VICGHIHCAAIKEVGGLTYINCGDWVDSCTGVIEHFDGRLELLDWSARPLAGSKTRTAELLGETEV